MKSRINASLFHLLMSFFLISFFAGFTVWHFYPSVFLDIENTADALKILIPADIILGPLLTFIIYKKGKPGLKFDLVFIIACQFMAMAYGCWAIYSARPGYLVFYGDTFYIVPPTIDQSFLSDNTLKVGKLDNPKIVSLHLPGDTKNHIALAMESLGSGIPLQWQTQYFKKFDGIRTETLAKASLDIDNLSKKADAGTLALITQIKHSGKQYTFIPVAGTRSTKVLALNLATRQPEYVLDIYPY